MQENRRGDLKFILTGIFLGSLFLLLNSLLGDIKPITYFFAMLIVILFFSCSVDFIKFWGPFLLFWLFYDLQHIFTKDYTGAILVTEIYDLEIAVTGWVTDGRVLAFIFQDYRLSHAVDALVISLDVFSALIYMTNLIGPIILGSIIYKKYRNSVEAKRFVFTFIGVSFAALITFQLFPAAPPWYIYNGGDLNFIIPQMDNAIKSAAGLNHVDELLGFPFFRLVYESLNANPFAPLPSIHNAYAIIVTIYAIRIIGKKARWLFFYPFSMAFASVWLDHHYIIDILLSIVYIIIFYFLAKYIFKTPSQTFEQHDKREMVIT
jgi:hypothetical protein